MKWLGVIRCLVVFAASWVSPGLLWAQSATVAQSDVVKVEVPEDNQSFTVKVNDREILEYRKIESPNKPYVRKLFTPAGVQILRDSPDDHKHHHALMFAVKADNVDFWGEQPNAGIEKFLARQSIRTSVENGFGCGEFSNTLEWIDPQAAKPLLEELRRISVFSGPDLKVTLLSWHTTLEPAKGKDSVVLGGDHYFGLGMRFVTSMDEEGEFLNSDNKEGESVRGSEKLTPARWCAYRSKADGKPVTVAMFDSPENPRHPNKFFTMRPFAYLAATLNLWKEPMTLKAGEPLKLTDVNQVLLDVFRNLQVAIDESGASVTSVDLPTVRADASQLVHVFQNLIANGIKFRREEPPRIHVSAIDDGQYWHFSVQDNGIGIEPQYADRVFVIFQRLHTRQEYPGTGIGLTVCKRIIVRHGGKIWFESEPGKGTTFFFTIPK